MPESDPTPEVYGLCNVCGRHDRLIEPERHGWVCVDFLSCLSTGLDTARELGRTQRQMRLWDGEAPRG